jgi:hypothetical protein
MKKNISLCFFLCLLAVSASSQPVDAVRKWLSQAPEARAKFESQSFAGASLSKRESEEVIGLLKADLQKQMSADLKAEWQAKELKQGAKTLKFEYKIFGNAPAGGRSLFISMHGGGNTSARANDQQWKNQIGLYTPAEGVYLAPRAPTNTWNLWHEAHIDTLFDKLIQAAVLFEGVNPDKVYLMGYSAGGDGVYQLAPRMADRFAAAAMMAGHPNETSPLGLRNIGFTLHMGALDNGFKRNEVAAKWALLLDSLQKQDPGGYKHLVKLHEGRPHWMNRQDTVAVPWMASFVRNPIPDKVVWKQDDMNHTDFYWLGVPAKNIQTGGEVIASYKGNEINVLKNYSDTLVVRVNDRMMNIDKPVTVNYLGKRIFKGKLKRHAGLIYQTLGDRKDAGLVFPAGLMIVDGKAEVLTNPVDMR